MTAVLRSRLSRTPVEETTLLTRTAGYVVNLECDIVGKYIEKLMKPAPEADKPSGGLTAEFLSAHGFL